ncbi:MAG: hypothetical protein ABI790_15690 [Betaproteobacteria bacterium]
MNRAARFCVRLAGLTGLCLVTAVPMVAPAASVGLALPRDGWISWQIQAVADAPDWCCWGDGRHRGDSGRQACPLDGKDYGYGRRGQETTDAVRLYARFADGKLERLRTLAASCPVTALSAIGHRDNITVDESVRWLVSLVAPGAAADSSRGRGLGGDAMAALAMHRGNTARDALAAIARKDVQAKNRRDALFWLTQVRGNEGAEIVAPIMFDDADAKVREHAAFAISQSAWPNAVAHLIRQGNSDREKRVRSQAWFWLAQTKSAETETAIRAALKNEPERQVREQGIFALSQLPNDRAARALIAVAEDKSLPREERKKAVFWLGQMTSDSAVTYLDRLLTATAPK